MWLKIKQQASGWPLWVKSEEDKQKYIRDYQKHEGIPLEYEKINKNEALRFIAKIMLNSFWGKLAQKPNQIQTEIVRTYDQVWSLVTDIDKEITGEYMVTDDTMIISWHFKDDSKDKVKNYNIAVASYVTAYARLKLYEIMEEIERKRPNSLLYYDTDSVLFWRKLTDPQVDCGDYLGELTDEIEKYGSSARCIKFVSLGPKNYAFVVKTKDGDITEIKSKGINLSNSAREIITFERMINLAVQYSQENNQIQLTVPQRQFTINRHSQVFTRQFEKVYQAVSEKRVINGNYTLPFGY